MPAVSLADDWRVIHDDLQWILQRRKKAGGGRWVAVAYCTTRAALIRNIRERCGETAALAEIETWPREFRFAKAL